MGAHLLPINPKKQARMVRPRLQRSTRGPELGSCLWWGYWQAWQRKLMPGNRKARVPHHPRNAAWSFPSLLPHISHDAQRLSWRNQPGPKASTGVAEAGSCSSHFTPSLGTSICRRCSPKKKNRKKKRETCYLVTECRAPPGGSSKDHQCSHHLGSMAAQQGHRDSGRPAAPGSVTGPPTHGL